MSDINIDDTMCRRPPVTPGAGRADNGGSLQNFKIYSDLKMIKEYEKHASFYFCCHTPNLSPSCKVLKFYFVHSLMKLKYTESSENSLSRSCILHFPVSMNFQL